MVQKILLFLFIFCGCRAHALPPVKSQICLTILQEVVESSPNIGSLDRNETWTTLAELRQLRTLSLHGTNAQPSMAVGFRSSQAGSAKLSEGAAASRVKGIEEYMNTQEGNHAGERQFTRVLTLVGSRNIQKFLETYKMNLRQAGQQFTKEIIKDWRASMLLNAFALSALNFEKIFSLDPMTQMGVLAGVVAIQIIWKQDFILKRPFFWDYSFNNDLENLENILNGTESEYWAILAKNFRILKKIQNQATVPVHDDSLFANRIRAQSLLEAPSLRDRLELYLAKRGHIMDSAWMGVDLILQKQKGAEPKLNVFIRGTQSVPLLPKTKPEHVPAKQQLDYGTSRG